jgi:hypothetical protein
VGIIRSEFEDKSLDQMTPNASAVLERKGGCMASHVISTTELKTLKLRGRGKVRDIYDLGDRLLVVATDRISAFRKIRDIIRKMENLHEYVTKSFPGGHTILDIEKGSNKSDGIK